MALNNSKRQILAPVTESKSNGLEYGELLRVSMDGLMANKLRTFLTMLGVIIGVASVVSLMTLGNGASNAITNQFSSLGTNNLTILPGRPNRGGPPGQIGVQPLTMTDVKTIRVLKLPINGPVPNFTNHHRDGVGVVLFGRERAERLASSGVGVEPEDVLVRER